MRRFRDRKNADRIVGAATIRNAGWRLPVPDVAAFYGPTNQGASERRLMRDARDSSSWDHAGTTELVQRPAAPDV